VSLGVPAEKIVSKIRSPEFFNVIVHFRLALQSAIQPRIHPVKHLRPPAHCLSAVPSIWGEIAGKYFNAILNAVRLRLVTPRSLVYSRTTLHYSLLSVFPGGVSSSNDIGGISQQQQQHSRQQLQIPHITAHGIGP